MLHVRKRPVYVAFTCMKVRNALHVQISLACVISRLHDFLAACQRACLCQHTGEQMTLHR